MLPYSGDDWDWGLSIGLRHLLTADINSRYFGNLIIVLMSRSPLLKTLIMGSASALIPVLISVFAINGPWKQRHVFHPSPNRRSAGWCADPYLLSPRRSCRYAAQMLPHVYARPWFAAALILMWISAPVVIAPLSVLDMGTGRIYITSNVFMIVYIAMLLSDILAGLPAAMLHKILFLCLAFVLILFIHYGSVFIEINACTNDRMTILEEMRQSDASTVSLPAYPHSNYLWLIEPSDDRLEYFKEFYKIPPDVNVRIVRNG